MKSKCSIYLSVGPTQFPLSLPALFFALLSFSIYFCVFVLLCNISFISYGVGISEGEAVQFLFGCGMLMRTL